MKNGNGGKARESLDAALNAYLDDPQQSLSPVPVESENEMAGEPSVVTEILLPAVDAMQRARARVRELNEKIEALRVEVEKRR